MKDVSWGERSRNRVSRPCDSMATPGQNVSSKTKNTLRRAMMRFRWAKAQVLTHSPPRPSARELNEHVLQFRLPHLAIAHHHRLLVEPAQDLGKPFLRDVDGALHAFRAHVELEDA